MEALGLHLIKFNKPAPIDNPQHWYPTELVQIWVVQFSIHISSLNWHPTDGQHNCWVPETAWQLQDVLWSIFFLSFTTTINQSKSTSHLFYSNFTRRIIFFSVQTNQFSNFWSVKHNENALTVNISVINCPIEICRIVSFYWFKNITFIYSLVNIFSTIFILRAPGKLKLALTKHSRSMRKKAILRPHKTGECFWV